MHPLTRKLDALRRRARLMVWMHALGRTLAGVLAVAIIAGSLDYVVRFQDRGLRIMASAAVLTTALALAWRLLLPAARTRLSDLDLALLVERRFPKLRDQLASTVEFLSAGADDDQAGSLALRREVIHQAATDSEHIDLHETLDARPAIRAGLTGAVAMAMIAALAVAAPDDFRIAAQRLAAPWSNASWPNANHLAIVKPIHRLAVGERFEVAVTDAQGARLPGEVRIHYRFDADTSHPQERVEPMRPTGGVMVAGVESVSRPFQYRAEGGDDDSMPWLELEVVEPPALEQFEVTLHYPDYTGWRPATAEPNFRALVGTRVAIAGRTNKPLASAVVHIEGGDDLPLLVAADGYSFSLSPDATPGFVVSKTVSFTLDLEDRDGFHSVRDVRYEVRGIEDRAPTVAIEEPPADAYLTAEAVVPVRALAKDDLAVRNLELHWSRSDRSEEPDTVVGLYSGPERVEPSEAADLAAPGHGEARNVEYRWDLRELGLKPGTRLSLFAAATDYHGATTQSHPRQLSIITSDELQDRLTERQGAILNELNRMLKLERDSRAQVSGVQIQLDQVGRLNKNDTDHLQQAELTQRQIDRGLGRRQEGVPQQLQNLLDELRNNQVANGEVEHRLNQALEEIDRLGRDHLPMIARELTSALKAAQESQDPTAKRDPPGGNETRPGNADPRVEKPLTAAAEHQDATIEGLEQLISNLTEWDNYRRFHRDIGQLRREQEELARDTAALGNATLTQELKDLKPQQLADLKKLGARQMDVARNFDKVQDRMQQMIDQLREHDPLTADTLDDAMHEAQKKTLGGQMREAGRSVEQNQVGQAGAAQQQIVEGLDEMLDILSNRRERELGRLVKKLKEAEQQLDQLHKQQEGLRKKIEANAHRDESQEQRRELQQLLRQQKQLQEEAERFARSLKRLQADQASRAASRAAGRMGQAGQQGEQGDAGGAAEQAGGAEQDLQDAQKQLAQQRQKAEADLAQEQIVRLEQTVGQFKQQQEKLLAETQHYDNLAREAGGLRRAHLLSLRDVARGERTLAEETQALAEKLSKGAFGLAVKSTARRMNDAADRLDARDTSSATQSRERQAIEQLSQILKAFESGPKQAGKKNSQQGQDQGGGQQGGGQTGPSELRLIKIMQEAINIRVAELAETAEQGKSLTADEQQEYIDLGEQQGALADLLLELNKPAENDAGADEDDLKKLLDPQGGQTKEKE